MFIFFKETKENKDHNVNESIDRNSTLFKVLSDIKCEATSNNINNNNFINDFT